jgi:primosomal protein N' (replication factor Y)
LPIQEKTEMFAKVVINIPIEKILSYKVPGLLEESLNIGKRVLVPLGKRKVTGYIVELVNSETFDGTPIKYIIELLDPDSLFNEEDLKFYRWISKYYMSPLGKVMAEILPSGIDIKSNRWITLKQEDIEYKDQTLSATKQAIIDRLKLYPKGMPFIRLKNDLGSRDISKALRELHNAQLVEVENRLGKPEIARRKEKIITLSDKIIDRSQWTTKQLSVIDFIQSNGDTSVDTLRCQFKNMFHLIKKMEQHGIIKTYEREVYRLPGQSPSIGVYPDKISLNEFQKTAFQKIFHNLSMNAFGTYLLHGVTGSGKTEVYLHLVEEVLKLNGGVIYLVPEIALTPQLLSRINQRFNDLEIAILHSDIPKASRYDQWRKIQQGSIKMVIGARSALFAPVRNLKLIIVDEEHDSSYKQDDRIRYNARDLAIVKAKIHSATIVLGSATPGIQTFFNAKKGKYKYLTLPQRVEGRTLPQVELVDMKNHKDENGKVPILSRTLIDAIHHTLKEGKQALLFLNRRGFSTIMVCFDCGHVFRCLNCEVSLTYHAMEKALKCHYCDFTIKAHPICQGCNGNNIGSYGVGTERLENEIKILFPKAKIARMDSDTTTNKESYGTMLQAFDKRHIDILVGTQMITKGHDFPGVTLVAVISADTTLNLPDFRAAERTFQLLTQFSGRGGRGDSPGKVIIQTFNPEHYAIKRAQNHDYDGFYADEISFRKMLFYPPFSRVVNIQLSTLHKNKGSQYADKIGKLTKDIIANTSSLKKVEMIGPAQAPIAKIRGRYRWQILLKGGDIYPLHTVIAHLLSKASYNGLDIKIDIDPENFM